MLKSWEKISATATSDVTCGRMTHIRNSVRARSVVLSRCASVSARNSCGTVEITQIASVFQTAFQKYESCSRSV